MLQLLSPPIRGSLTRVQVSSLELFENSRVSVKVFRAWGDEQWVRPHDGARPMFEWQGDEHVVEIDHDERFWFDASARIVVDVTGCAIVQVTHEPYSDNRFEMQRVLAIDTENSVIINQDF